MTADTPEPTTTAGRALLDTWDKDRWDFPYLLDDILAIEAEARQQDASALREALDRVRPEDNIEPRGRIVRKWWRLGWLSAIAVAKDALAALPPSAPAGLDVDDRPCSVECCDAQERRHIHISAAEYARLEQDHP